MLTTGIKGLEKIIVNESNTAAAVGSGLLPVFATPALIALMEKAAADSVEPYLSLEESTVGILINVKHTAATPLNMEVHCESELIEIDRKRLVFQVKAYDEKGLIGEGIHERFIINKSSFMDKVMKK
ncbi:MAG: thioesterase family protein [Clostridiaceae bacterium]